MSDTETFVKGEVADFAKVPATLIQLTHRLGVDLRLVKPALVFLAQSLRAHIRARNPGETLLVTEIERPDFTVGQLVALVRSRMGAEVAAVNAELIKVLTVVVLMLLWVGIGTTYAQTVFTDLQVRKSFNGGREEQQPGTIAYVFREHDPDFALVDVAVKHKGKDWEASGRRPEILLYPAFEWHRGLAEPLRGVAADFNKLSGSVLAEVYFSDLFAQPLSSSGAGSGSPPITLAPWGFFKAEYARNYVKDVNEGQFAALASVFSQRNWLPGADTTIGGRRAFKYVPYVGFEYFENLAIEANKQVVAPSYSGLQLTTRLYVEWFPVPQAIPGQNRLVVTAEFNNRVPISGTTVDGVFNAAGLSIDWYLDDKQQFAIGLSHERGESPRANFTSQQRTALGFRIKI